jgi:ADP-ribosyl-[dinitrogen reductase] hydrolase
MSVRAAVTALTAADGLSDLLKRCVDFTGDVDTVAAIALGAGAHCDELARDLPIGLYDGLERGAYGASYLRDLDARLLALVPAVQASNRRISQVTGVPPVDGS